MLIIEFGFLLVENNLDDYNILVKIIRENKTTLLLFENQVVWVIKNRKLKWKITLFSPKIRFQ